MDLTTEVLFNDKDIKIRTNCLMIKKYYFPIGTSKRIPIADIRDVQLVFQSISKIWGITTLDYWLTLDSQRSDYKCFIAIDTGHDLKPTFTCTDHEAAYHLLKQLV